MSAYGLDRIFAARSLALVGASVRERSLGRTVLRNLQQAGFDQPIYVVNPKYRSSANLRQSLQYNCYRAIRTSS
jgi:acetyltransferase